MWNRLLDLLKGRPAAGVTARELAGKLGGAVQDQGGALRITGTWKGLRCQVLLDPAADVMTVTARAGPHHTTFDMHFADSDDGGLTSVSTHSVASAADAQRLEKIPMRIRLHLIEVVEAGRGSLRLQDGQYTLHVSRAGLARPNAGTQATIRLDVLAELVAAASRAW
jgi:hypothetical protein